MIYRFDHNWEGEVIAESRATAATSYLGNRFPAGDIPPQARALYTRNTLRIVSDIELETVPLIPQIIPGTRKPLDLTYSVLRAFSPVHVEYLRNMEVRASASISILDRGKLWGLVACHHSGPMYITHPVRDMLEFVGRIISMKLAGLEAGRQLSHSKQLSRTTISVLKHLSAANFASGTIQRHEAEILGLVNAGGALLILNNKRYLLGTVPGEADVDALLAWLAQQPENDHFVTDHLAAHMPAAERFANCASGCFVTPVSNDMANAMIWFRPERLRTVQWAGKPEKIMQTDELGQLRISPRKSFASWKETWRNRSDEWYAEEIATGAAFAEVLIDVMLK
jgi:light-regulated signal transduction histidine kinase (bacteriophytochrome)